MTDDFLYVEHAIYCEKGAIIVPLFVRADPDPFRFQRSCDRMARVALAATEVLHPEFGSIL